MSDPVSVSVVPAPTTACAPVASVTAPALPSSVPPLTLTVSCDAVSVRSVSTVPPRSVAPSSTMTPGAPPAPRSSACNVPPAVLSTTPCRSSVPPTAASRPLLMTVLVPVLTISVPPLASTMPAELVVQDQRTGADLAVADDRVVDVVERVAGDRVGDDLVAR